MRTATSESSQPHVIRGARKRACKRERTHLRICRPVGHFFQALPDGIILQDVKRLERNFFLSQQADQRSAETTTWGIRCPLHEDYRFRTDRQGIAAAGRGEGRGGGGKKASGKFPTKGQQRVEHTTERTSRPGKRPISTDEKSNWSPMPYGTR